MSSEYKKFYERLWEYYEMYGRHDLPWRQPDSDGTFDPYKILLSEIMLQQTQVPRVIPKYHSFLESFPTFTTLANATLGDVLRQWQGLGYNRRAKFLWQAVQQVVELSGVMPSTSEELIKLPGIGKNTAGAVMAYAYNQPAIFIETNIRTVYIHHFFKDAEGIEDKEIAVLLTKTIDVENPRAFYWALMDYGTHIKQTHGNLNKLSKSYVKQNKFHGSKRQIRGAVLRALHAHPKTYDELQNVIHDERLDAVLADLVSEDMIIKDKDRYLL